MFIRTTIPATWVDTTRCTTTHVKCSMQFRASSEWRWRGAEIVPSAAEVVD